MMGKIPGKDTHIGKHRSRPDLTEESQVAPLAPEEDRHGHDGAIREGLGGL